MNQLQKFLSIAFVISLGACSTTMPSTQSGFLTGDADLKSSEAGGARARRAQVAVDPARVHIGEIKWMVPTRTDISSDERSALLTLLRDELEMQVQQLPAVPGGRPVVLRAAVTRVDTVSPALNALSAALLLIPLDRGGAAVEIEAIDADTGTQVAAIQLGYFAPLSDLFARFSKLAPAEIALRKAAAEFKRMLAPAGSASAATDARVTMVRVAHQ
jgi:hypothetical protein